MGRDAIFIHSLFRTGSTYIWNKFRQHDEFHCYYEPFHQEMVNLDANRPYIWRCDQKTTRSMGHPDLDKDYLFEYRNILRSDHKGLPFFKKSFSFDDYCRNRDNPEQKNYIDCLIQGAGNRLPLLQFNRSALRIRWFKSHYPQGLHIYLLRNPRHQFQSYISMARQNNLDIFLIMDLIISGVNRESSEFRDLANQVPLFEYHSPRFDDERVIYSYLLPIYSDAERYFIFYYIWFLALMENALHADFLLSIDLLAANGGYRQRFLKFLAEAKIKEIDFSDVNIKKYDRFVLNETEMAEIEERAQSLVLKRCTEAEAAQMATVLGDKSRLWGGMDKVKFLSLREREIKNIDIEKSGMEKYYLLFKSFSGGLVDQNREIRQLRAELERKRNRIIDLEKDIKRILAGLPGKVKI